jgi:hypothetical protein
VGKLVNYNGKKLHDRKGEEIQPMETANEWIINSIIIEI